MTERDEAHGLLTQRDFGGTKKWRACYVSDGTGHAMLYAMSDQAIAHSIPVHERMEALSLLGVQWVYLAGLILLTRAAWRNGLRHYAAYGG